MIILHAGFQEKHLLLWGETAPAETESKAKTLRSVRKARAVRPTRLLYDAGIEGLLTALAEVFSGLQLKESDFEKVAVWLPSVAGQALASNVLIADPVESKSPPVLSPWTVTALPLATVEAIELLSLCVDKQMLSPGVVVGWDLKYWAAAMRFAGAITVRQQFLPSVVKEDGKYHARWQPVFAGQDAERLQKLARAMPQVCRAMATSKAEVQTPPDAAAAAVLAEFVAVIVDHLARVDRECEARAKGGGDTLHDQWLNALRTMQSELPGKESELAQLAAQTRDWRRPVEIGTSAPFRLSFRLEEPEDSGQETSKASRRSTATSRNGWHVRYLLQAADDPSLLVPVAEAWKGKESAVLKRPNFNVREYLLSALGQASGIDAHIENSLKSAQPAGYGLDAAGAFDFLQEKAWLLEQSGFNVMLPAWWTRKGTKLRLTARANVKSPKLQGGGGLSLDEIIKFDYQVALGDEVLSLKELEALAKLKMPLVKIRGQWVQLSAEEIQTAIEFWKKKAEGKATVRELVHMSLGAGKAVKGIAFDGVNADGWIGDLLARLDGRLAFRELEPAENFNGVLRPYQMRGLSWLGFLRDVGFGACLADDMGLGKTVQTLALIQRDWQAAKVKNRRPVLLVCPMSVMGNWQKEAARFTSDLPVMIHHGLTRSKGAAFKKEAANQALVISSYSLLHRDLAILEGVNWQGVILDEAQNIKNAETKQSKAARSLKSDYRIALTGTPVENNVGDLWSIMEFLNPGFLGNQTEFKRNFFLPIQTQRDPLATARLKRLTTPFILRRLKTDKTIINDLPDKMEMKVFCNLTKEQASLYAAVAEDAGKSLEDADGMKRRGLVLATLMKLKQVCNHPAQFLGDNSKIPGRSGKLARLTEMLEEILPAGERALVFTQFTEMGDIIQRHLRENFGQEVLFLHGGVTKKNRDRMVERFQKAAAGSPQVFLLSLKAGGTGLNLTAANHVFHFDRWWNPAVENQATDRAFRIGQQRNVQVHKFLCAGTLEEKIDEMIERKSEIASSIVGTGEGWLTELSTKDLKELFALRADAVGE